MLGKVQRHYLYKKSREHKQKHISSLPESIVLHLCIQITVSRTLLTSTQHLNLYSFVS